MHRVAGEVKSRPQPLASVLGCWPASLPLWLLFQIADIASPHWGPDSVLTEVKGSLSIDFNRNWIGTQLPRVLESWHLHKYTQPPFVATNQPLSFSTLSGRRDKSLYTCYRHVNLMNFNLKKCTIWEEALPSGYSKRIKSGIRGSFSQLCHSVTLGLYLTLSHF